MPHVTVEAWLGKAEEQNKCLASRAEPRRRTITKAIVDMLEHREHFVSVAIESVPAKGRSSQRSLPRITDTGSTSASVVVLQEGN